MQLKRIADDAVGFCAMEVCRTSLGFAGARDPERRISSAAALDRYQAVAVNVVRNCLLCRGNAEDSGGGVRALFGQLQDTEGLARRLRGAGSAEALPKKVQ